MANYRLFVNSSTGVDIDPEYDFADVGTKVETRIRTRTGREYVYKWGEHTGFKFSVSYVNSSFKSLVNGWWSSNTELLFMETGVSASVTSVHLENKGKPIDKRIKPYDDQFRGKIELGTY